MSLYEKIRVVRGDITRIPVDAIVNAAAEMFHEMSVDVRGYGSDHLIGENVDSGGGGARSPRAH